MIEDISDLLFVSNTIELKLGKKYLLVFKGATRQQLEGVMRALGQQGVDCVGIGLRDGQDVQIIEAPC